MRQSLKGYVHLLRVKLKGADEAATSCHGSCGCHSRPPGALQAAPVIRVKEVTMLLYHPTEPKKILLSNVGYHI